MGMYLRDLTSGTILISESELYWAEVYHLDVVPSHEYELRLWGWIDAWDAKEANLNLQVRIAGFSVPDGGSTLLLFAAALVPLCAVGRYRSR